MTQAPFQAHFLTSLGSKKPGQVNARTIPLSGSALALLRALSEYADPMYEHVLPITENAANMAWKRLAKRARLENLRFHDLRHEAISRFFREPERARGGAHQ